MLQWSKTYGLEEAIEAIEGAVQPRTVLNWFDGRKPMSGLYVFHLAARAAMTQRIRDEFQRLVNEAMEV